MKKKRQNKKRYLKFLKPTKSKILLFLIPFSFNIFMMLFRGKVRCEVYLGEGYSQIIRRCVYDDNLLLFMLGIIFFPVFYLYGIFLFGVETPDNFAVVMYIFVFVLQAAYWYLLACIIVTSYAALKSYREN